MFTEAGGEIVKQFWHPLNTADFSPYLGQLANMKIDAVFAMENGADATRLIQQYASFGLKGQIPLLSAMNTTDQSVIRTLGPECEGIVSAAHFAEGSDNPVTQKFVKDYSAKYEKIPSLFGFSMYSGSMWLSQAIDKIRAMSRTAMRFIDTVLEHRTCKLAARQDGQARCLRQPDLRRLHPQGGEATGRQILERADRDLSERLTILDLRSGDLHEAAALFAHVPGHQEDLVPIGPGPGWCEERRPWILPCSIGASDRIDWTVADPILSVRDVTVAFDALRAVDGVTLAVPRGQRRAIIGPNGAGKTTLFNAITGMVLPTAGRIVFDGHDMTRLPPHRRARLGIARTFQITNLFPTLSVEDNIVLALRGRSRAQILAIRLAGARPPRATPAVRGAWQRHVCPPMPAYRCGNCPMASSASSKSRLRSSPSPRFAAAR